MNIPEQNKVSSLRKYIYEYCLLTLAGAVVTLFWLYLDLSGFIRKELIQQTVKQEMIIERNTEALKNFNSHQIFKQ